MSRSLLTLAVALAIVLSWFGMRRGWQRLASESAGIAEPQPLLAGTTVAGPWTGRYLGATRGGQWLQRVTAHTLGHPSEVTCSLTTEGLQLERPGERSFGVARHDLVAVRADTGIAGRAYEEGGIIVITVRLGDDLLDLGLRLPSTTDHLAALAALTAASGATA